MKRLFIFIFSVSVLLSCEKEPQNGGDSTIVSDLMGFWVEDYRKYGYSANGKVFLSILSQMMANGIITFMMKYGHFIRIQINISLKVM